MKKTKKLIVLSALIVMACFLIITLSVVNSTAYAMDSNLNTLMEEIDEKIVDKKDLAYSSNPYDYIKDNENYEKIVDLKIEALPLLMAKLEESDEAGLKEYIISIAIQEISGVEIAEGRWSNGREFLEEYKAFLRNVKDGVNVILTSENTTEQEKLSALSKYGIYAVPYIPDNLKAADKIQMQYKKSSAFVSLTTSDLNIIENMIDKVLES